jgi:hypothetical protein
MSATDFRLVSPATKSPGGAFLLLGFFGNRAMSSLFGDITDVRFVRYALQGGAPQAVPKLPARARILMS